VRDLVVSARRRAVQRDQARQGDLVGRPPARERARVHYAVYGHDLSVRTNHIDAGHALLHGPATFVYPPHLRSAPIELDVAIPRAGP